MDIHQRFAKYVDDSGECWLWIGSKIKSKWAYGQLKVNGKNQSAHRVSYQLYKGQIPEGLVVRHTCNNPCCVNPEHLELGTQQENMDDMVNANRQALGSRNGRSKIKEEDVPDIRRRLALGETYYSIGKLYGVTHTPIKQIKEGKSFSYVGSHIFAE
jgi:hypothetical protein